MKDLPESEQPYVLAEEKGVSTLTDAQLLSIFLKNGSEGERALDMSMRILSIMDGSGRDPLTALCQLSIEELKELKGIGRVKAIQIQAISELAKRLAEREAATRFKFNDPSSVADIFMEHTRYLQHEEVWVLFLNAKLEMISRLRLSTGTIDLSVIDQRDIFMKGFQRGAYSFILLHNHPSGDPHPSLEDDELTVTVRDQSAMMRMPMQDHIILGDHDFYSYKRDSDLL